MGESTSRMSGAASVARLAAGGLVWSVLVSGVALAQPTGPNAGALTFTGGFDVPSVFVFRGIVQEVDPRLTVQPAAEVAVALGKGLTAGLGVRHSVHTGSAGSEGPTGRSHYREDVFASIGAPVGGGLRVTMTYAAFTSPNFLFDTVHDLSFTIVRAGRYAPYALVAFELAGAADQLDHGTGRYLELGVGPTYRLRSATTLRIPLKVGLSLSHYYEQFTGDSTFGFLSVGGLVVHPLGGRGVFGSWDVRGGAEVYTFGDATKGFNANRSGDVPSARIVARVGIGVSY